MAMREMRCVNNAAMRVRLRAGMTVRLRLRLRVTPRMGVRLRGKLHLRQQRRYWAALGSATGGGLLEG